MMDGENRRPLWHVWLKICEFCSRRKIRECIEQINQRWPGRYRFKIVPRRRHGYEVYVRHLDE